MFTLTAYKQRLRRGLRWMGSSCSQGNEWREVGWGRKGTKLGRGLAGVCVRRVPRLLPTRKFSWSPWKGLALLYPAPVSHMSRRCSRGAGDISLEGRSVHRRVILWTRADLWPHQSWERGDLPAGMWEGQQQHLWPARNCVPLLPWAPATQEHSCFLNMSSTSIIPHYSRLFPGTTFLPCPTIKDLFRLQHIPNPFSSAIISCLLNSLDLCLPWKFLCTSPVAFICVLFNIV